MKNKKIKGFTLIECLVAITILGVTSLLICQAYSQMMKITKTNNIIYHSLSDQMDAAETKNNANSKLISGSPVIFDKTNNCYNNGQELIMSRVETKTDSEYNTKIVFDSSGNPKTKQDFKTSVNVYCANPYVNGVMKPATTTEDGTDVRFVYFYNK